MRKRLHPWTRVNRKGVLDCERRHKVNSPKETFNLHPMGTYLSEERLGLFGQETTQVTSSASW